jgi:phage-related tail protein
MAHWTDYGKEEVERMMRALAEHEREAIEKVMSAQRAQLSTAGKEVPLHVRVTRLHTQLQGLSDMLSAADGVKGEVLSSDAPKPMQSVEVMVESLADELDRMSTLTSEITERLHVHMQRL